MVNSYGVEMLDQQTIEKWQKFMKDGVEPDVVTKKKVIDFVLAMFDKSVERTQECYKQLIKEKGKIGV